VVREYLWGTQYLDELVCLWVQKCYHMFVAHDANYNAIGLTDKTGNEVERYAYNPYGQVLVDQTSGRGDFDGDGDVDSADNTLLDNNKTQSPTEAQLLYDRDGDGDVDDAPV